MMQFYSSPGSCALGIRVLLEDTGAPYTAHRLNLAAREQLDEPYRSVNPKGKVPALVRADGSLVTEFQTIAFWLADAFPDAGLLPAGAEGRMRAMELLDFIVGSVHMRGFTFVIAPGKFSQNPEFQKELSEHGRAQVVSGFATLSDALGTRDYLLGDYGVADAALFYLTRWAVALDIPLPRTIADHHNRMLARPAVQRALLAEGIEVNPAP